MIKLIATGAWICAVTLASVYFSMNMTHGAPEEPAKAEFFGGLDYVRGDVMSVPVLADGKVKGYFIARLVYTVDPKEYATLTVPAGPMITDAAYTLLMGNSDIAITDMNRFDLDRFRTAMRDALNKKVGRDLFKEVLVEQIDYLTKEEIRANVRQSSAGAKASPNLPDKTADAGSAPAH